MHVQVRFVTEFVHNACMIDPRLELLVAVAEYGTVTAAAEAHHRSPSGVSRALRDLGREIGTPLLTRAGRRVELTPAGHQLAADAGRLRALTDRARTAALAAAGGGDDVRGRVQVGTHPTAITALAAPVLARLRRRHPRLEVSWTEIESEHSMVGLDRGWWDLVLLPVHPRVPSAADSRYVVTEVMREPIDLQVPAGHPWEGRTDLALAEAAAEPWIVGARHHGSEVEILTACRQAGFTPRATHRVQDRAAVSALVAAGEGLYLLPRLAPLGPGTARVPLAGPHAPTRTVVACRRAGHRSDRSQAEVLAAVREQAASLLGG